MSTSRRMFLGVSGGMPVAAMVNSPEALIQGWAELWRPPQRLTLSQWAEKNFRLSSDYSALSGTTVRLYGYQREIFDSFTDPRVQKIVLKVGTQMVKTLFIQAALAYIICEMPGPTLLVQPKDPDAETFSKERLAPMIRDNQALSGLIDDKRSPTNTITYKQFPGGSLTLVGAMVPGNAARRTIRYLLADEINKYPKSVGEEGSFIRLAEERLMKFGTRSKAVYACSPTTPNAAISREYEASDQREPFVPCLFCGHAQVMVWTQVRWDSSAAFDDRPDTARYYCEKCDRPWNDLQRWQAAQRTEWRGQKPFRGTAGFGRLGHLYAPDKTLAKMVRTWLEINASKDTNELRVFLNTNLAQDWRVKGETPEWRRLYERREDYPIGVVPHGAFFLTLFCDVQGDRLECEVKAWGRNWENWSIWYEVIAPERPGPDGKAVRTTPADPEPWNRLAELILKDWPHADGGSIPIWCAGVDTGNKPEQGYAFCRQWAQPIFSPQAVLLPRDRYVVATKGGHNPYKLIEHISDTNAAQKRGGLRVITIGTHCAKDELYDALKIEKPLDGQTYPVRYCHYPHDYDASYFQGLTAEERTVTEKGKIEWDSGGRRNEPLDDHVGNRALAELCGISRFKDADWARLEQKLAQSRQPQAAQNSGPAFGGLAGAVYAGDPYL